MIIRQIAIVLVLVILVLATTGTAFCVNPYCVAGYGVLTKLGMPAESTDYNWNWLQPDRLIQMVRPNHYYNYIGIPVRWYGYNELTDEINDPAQLQAWVLANPGKIWIIGNEPDIDPQDGLTKEQYVRMYKKYYDFIKPLDPTAKFCIGAITGGSTTAALNYTKSWYQDVLNLYKQTYGVRMPIDIWNIHSYCGPKQIEDPDKIINEFVIPFVNWCHTVEGGAYAGSPVWITELPIGEWMGALSVENTIWFMQHYMPRLERAGIERFFWYVSSDWDGNQGSCALTKAGQVTAVGAAYAALANSYPNAVPPVTPFVPDPTPAWHTSDFSGSLAAPWFNKGGYWSFTSGELRHTGIYPFNGTTCALLYVYQDLGVSFKMKMDSAADPANWGAVVIRATSRWDTGWDSGYMFFVRQNGEAALYNKTDGVVASLPGAVTDPQNWHSYRIVVQGYNIKVWIDGTLKINWTDANQRYSSGYIIAQCHRSDVSYDDFHVLRYPTPSPVVTDDGIYTTELNHIHASWAANDPGCGILGYAYAIGTSVGATNIVEWTNTTQTSIDLPINLTPGTKYYVSVKALYPDGFESMPGTSDGIVAVLAVSHLRELRTVSPETYVLVQNKIVSGVFSDCIYVQEPNRSSGIRVKGIAGLQVGNVITLTGKITLDNQEVILQDANLVSCTAGNPPRPLAMTGRALGGSAFGFQPAPANNPLETATGLSPIGLLVRTTGQVTYVDPGGSWAYIDDGSGICDGSGHIGIRTLLVGSVPTVGANAEITGCCGVIDVNGRCARLLRPRSTQDVHFSSISSYLSNGSFETGSFAPWFHTGTGTAIISGTWYFSISAYSGNSFLGVYGNYATHSGSLIQSVEVPPGTYSASVWSRVLHGGNTAEAAKNRIGIDPTGGIDPNSPSVQWSDWDTQSAWYYSEWRELSTPIVSSPGGTVTVFLQYLQQETAGWHINCFDSAKLELK